jgi:hypothetical protein
VRRRALLAGLTAGLAGLAGCQGLGGSGGRDDPYEVPPRETSTVAGIDPATDAEAPESLSRVVSAQVGPDRKFAVAGPPLSNNPWPGRYTVGFTAGPRPSGPATVRIQFTSTADRPREYEFGPSPPFSNYWSVRTGSDGSPRGLLLVPIDDRPFPYGDLVPEQPSYGRWEANESLGKPDGTPEERTIELDPGQSISGEYALLIDPEADWSTSRATYAFEGADWTVASLAVSTWDPGLQRRFGSRFEGRSVPDLPYSAPIRWFHRLEDDDPPVYLDPTRERVESIPAVLSPTVENYTLDVVEVGRRTLFKLRDGTWYPIGPLPVERGRPRSLAPGGSLRGELDVNDEARSETARSPTTFLGLGGGLYAVAAPAYGVSSGPPRDEPVVLEPRSVSSGDPQESTRGDPAILAALIEFDRYEAYVTPLDSAELVSQEGGTATVRLGTQGDGDPDGDGSAVLTVDRSSDADPALKLIPEQVLQLSALRTALANFVRDIETVRVLADEWTVRRPIEAFGDGYRIRFDFEGTTYVARWRRRTGDE